MDTGRRNNKYAFRMIGMCKKQLGIKMFVEHKILNLMKMMRTRRTFLDVFDDI